MSLAASLRHEKATGIRKGPACQVCLLLDTLTGEDLAELQDALADPAVAHSQIGRALRAEGSTTPSAVTARASARADEPRLTAGRDEAQAREGAGPRY